MASKFTQCALGWLKFDKAGTHNITLNMPEGGITADVTSISLTPVSL
ncbi:MAG: hypothetical protein ACI4AH_02565 [Muribaculaceae bacterium]